jgi:hypothetical protein
MHASFGPGVCHKFSIRVPCAFSKIVSLKLAADLLLKIKKKDSKFTKYFTYQMNAGTELFKQLSVCFSLYSWYFWLEVFAIELCSSARSKKMRHYCVQKKRKENEALAKVD